MEEEMEDIELPLCNKCKKTWLLLMLNRYDELLSYFKDHKALAQFILDKLMSDAFIRIQYDLTLEFERLKDATSFPLNPSKRQKKPQPSGKGHG